MSSSKEKFRNLVRRLRGQIKNKDKEDLYTLEDLIKSNRMDVYFNKKSWILLNKFYLDDGSEIELTNDEMNALSVILFYEIDLMQENNNIEIKKESKISKENIWHFNPDLAEYNMNRLLTMVNHFKEEGLRIYDKTRDTYDVLTVLMNKCSYRNEYHDYVYEFDNGSKFEFTRNDLENIVKVLIDEY